ncbi:MAG: inositol oxygenase family protein, partial [Eudoraea sp.]
MEKVFRDYNKPDVNAAVRDHYRKMRERQTFEYVQEMQRKYLMFNKPMDLWDAMIHLNDLIDV